MNAATPNWSETHAFDFEEIIPRGPHYWFKNKPHWTSNEVAVLDRQYMYCSSAITGHEVTNIVDGDDGSDWECYDSTDQWVIFDLGKPCEISSFRYNSPSGPSCPRECVLMFTDAPDCVGTDTVGGMAHHLPGFGPAWAIADEWMGSRQTDWSSPHGFSPRVARFWKLLIKNTWGENAIVAEVNFYGIDKHISPEEEQKMIEDAERDRRRTDFNPNLNDTPTLTPNHL